jgi:hypothetical protein
MSAARQARVDALENASELLSASRGEVAELQQALASQLAENSTLVQQVADLRALLERRNSQAAERRTLYGTVAQAVRTLDEMENT